MLPSGKLLVEGLGREGHDAPARSSTGSSDGFANSSEKRYCLRMSPDASRTAAA